MGNRENLHNHRRETEIDRLTTEEKMKLIAFMKDKSLSRHLKLDALMFFYLIFEINYVFLNSSICSWELFTETLN